MGNSFSQQATKAVTSLCDPFIWPYYGLNVLFGVTQYVDMESLHPDGSYISVFFKTIPIWYLIAYINIILRRRKELDLDFYAIQQQEDDDGFNIEDEIRYTRHTTMGLVLSSIGDAFLVFPSTFVHGVVAFGAAHLFYILGLRKRYSYCSKRAKYAWFLFPVIFLVTSPYILSEIEPYPLMGLVLFYIVTINTMLFYAVAGFETIGNSRSLLAMAGALSFVVSDFIIAMDRWILVSSSLRYRNFIVMTTYYFAQVNIALSVF